MKINKDEYIKLINDDAKWLVENTENSLEREHILKVLWASIDLQYQPNASQQQVEGGLAKSIRSVQVKTGEQAVLENLKKLGL